MSNKITNKITGNITGKITGKNFTGSGAGSFMGVFFVGLLFSLVAGVGNLQAQEREQGWFVGVSPFVMDVKLKKTSRITSEERTQVSELVTENVAATIYDATVPNFYLDNIHTGRFGSAAHNRLAVANAATADAISLCQNGAIPIITEGDVVDGSTFDPDSIYLRSYDETTDLTSGLSQLLIDTTPTTIDTGATGQAAAAPLCKAFFESGLSSSNSMPRTVSDDTTPLPEEITEETSNLKGTGISVGFNFEKYSLSFNQLQWSAGDDKLQAQVLLARYFLPYGLSVGGGLASAKLNTSFGSASGTAPALHFAYNYPVTKNLQIQVGLFWLGLDLAVQDTQIISAAPTTTTSALTTTAPTLQRRAILGLQRSGGDDGNNYFAIEIDNPRTSYDTRIVVTATIPSGVSTTTTTTTTKTVSGGRRHRAAEIKNPATISINFIWRFR